MKLRQNTPPGEEARYITLWYYTYFSKLGIDKKSAGVINLGNQFNQKNVGKTQQA